MMLIPAELSEAHIQRFLRRRRRHRGPIRPETRRREEYDVRHVLGFLRSGGVCAQAIASSTPIEDLVAAFARHLREQRGLASPTIERYTSVARQFLENHFSAGEIDMRAVVAIDIIEFIRGQVAHLRPPGLKCVVTAMRSFLRYGQHRGDVAGELVAAVPAVATWATTPALPRAISSEHAQRAIDSCDLGTAIGLRDRAILLILARLGLRANEVITLQLGFATETEGTFEFGARAAASVCCPCPMTWVAPLPRTSSAAGRSATIATCSCARRRRSAASCMARTPSARS
ncbi:integrase [Variovorax guangxiensis]|nr:integrase [Variovorax guangxiensis]